MSRKASPVMSSRLFTSAPGAVELPNGSTVLIPMPMARLISLEQGNQAGSRRARRADDFGLHGQDGTSRNADEDDVGAVFVLDGDVASDTDVNATAHTMRQFGGVVRRDGREIP